MACMYEYYCNIPNSFTTSDKLSGFLSVNQSFLHVCVFMCVCSCVEGSQELSAFPYAPIKASQQ